MSARVSAAQCWLPTPRHFESVADREAVLCSRAGPPPPYRAPNLAPPPRPPPPPMAPSAPGSGTPQSAAPRVPPRGAAIAPAEVSPAAPQAWPLEAPLPEAKWSRGWPPYAAAAAEPRAPPRGRASRLAGVPAQPAAGPATSTAPSSLSTAPLPRTFRRGGLQWKWTCVSRPLPEMAAPSRELASRIDRAVAEALFHMSVRWWVRAGPMHVPAPPPQAISHSSSDAEFDDMLVKARLAELGREFARPEGGRAWSRRRSLSSDAIALA